MHHLQKNTSNQSFSFLFFSRCLRFNRYAASLQKKKGSNDVKRQNVDYLGFWTSYSKIKPIFGILVSWPLHSCQRRTRGGDECRAEIGTVHGTIILFFKRNKRPAIACFYIALEFSLNKKFFSTNLFLSFLRFPRKVSGYGIE